MNKTCAIVYEALQWAFRTFSDNLLLYLKLFALSAAIMLVTGLFTFGLALLVVPFYLTLCHINIAMMLYEGKQITNLKQFFVAWQPFLKAYAALWLYGMLVNVGLILLIIPGLYLASRYYYIVYAILIDRKGIIESFSYSERLTAPLPWHGLLLLLCATVLGGSLIFLGVAALMNVHAYKQCQKTGPSVLT